MKSSNFWGIVIILLALICASGVFWFYTESQQLTIDQKTDQAATEREPSEYVNSFIDKLTTVSDNEGPIPQEVILPTPVVTSNTDVWSVSELFGDFNREESSDLSRINWAWQPSTQSLNSVSATSTGTVNSFVYQDKCTRYLSNCVIATQLDIKDTVTNAPVTQAMFTLYNDLQGNKALAIRSYSTASTPNIGFEFPLYPIGTCPQGTSQTINGVTITCTKVSTNYTFPEGNRHGVSAGTVVSNCRQVDLTWSNGASQETLYVCPVYGLVNKISI